MKVAPTLKRVPEESRRFASNGWASGVGIGLAIYSGMFMVAGVWRSDEVALAVQSGKATPAGAALHSFQQATIQSAVSVRTAFAEATTPTARFVEPQRVTLAFAAAPASALPSIRDTEMPSSADEFAAPPVRLHPIDSETHAILFSSVPLAPLDMTGSLDAMSVDIEGLRGTL